MASLPGAAMKKSSGYGSALSLARAISVSARAGDSGSLGCGSGQPYSQRALGQFGLQPVVGGSHVAAAHIFATAQQALRRRRVFKDSASRKARFMASAKRCQRRERRLLNDIRHVASGLVHRIRHRLQAARAAAEDQFLPVNHAAAVGGFKQHAVRGGAGNQPRAVHLPDGGDVVGDLLLGRAQRLPQANFSGDEEE